MTKAAGSDMPDTKWFRADIAWLGPIHCAPDAAGNITIAGAEDPALGKCFAASLVPVTEIDGHFHVAAPGIWSRDAFSDAYGWFAVSPPADRWQQGATGVLLVLVYNQSPDLEYYTYHDYNPTPQPTREAATRAKARLKAPPRIVGPMPDDMKPLIDDAIAKAIDVLLKNETARTLRKALAEVRTNVVAADSPEGAELEFAVGSCQYPTAMLEHAVSGGSYARLGARLDRERAHGPQFVLLLGDQVYVDGTAGLFDPTSQFDRYVRPYELLYRMDATRDVLRRLPAFMMMDDHEIRDNWEPRTDDRRSDPAMIDGRRSYVKFQRRAGPPLRSPVDDARNPIWFDFDFHGFGVFMADTRTERSARTARTFSAARIMSDGQHAALLGFLAAPAGTPRIVASPSILLPRHARAVQWNQAVSALRSDAWDGYPLSLHEVLAFIAHERIRNVVFLSGDEHLGCVARIEVAEGDQPPVVVHSVHSSPLFAPFPFANSQRCDLVANEAFDFDAPSRPGATFHCSVTTEFAPPGDGFAVLRFRREDGGWKMHCEFDRAHEEGARASIIERKLA
jgi:hypothetical protein